MYETVIVNTGNMFINIYSASKDDIVRLFKEKYHSKIIEIINREHPIYAILTANVDIGIQTITPKLWVFTICDIKYVSELLQLFADETLKAEIIRKVFEHV